MRVKAAVSRRITFIGQFLRFQLWNFETRSPVVVFTMGKCGTMTIRRTLEATQLCDRVVTTHRLTERSLDQAEAYFRGKGREFSYEVFFGRMVARKLRSLNNKASLKYITAVRDPIATHISGFFQNIDTIAPHLRRRDGTVDAQGAIATLEGRLMVVDVSSDYQLNWFEQQFRPATGLDVFSTPFNPEKGFCIVGDQGPFALVVRLEDFDSVLSQSLSEFLALDSVKVHTANTTGSKPEREAYNWVKSNLKLPQQVVQNIYSTQLVRHFWSEHEIEEMVRRWTRPYQPRHEKW